MAETLLYYNEDLRKPTAYWEQLVRDHLSVKPADATSEDMLDEAVKASQGFGGREIVVAGGTKTENRVVWVGTMGCES